MARASTWTLVALASIAATLALTSRRCAADPQGVPPMLPAPLPAPAAAVVRLEEVARGLKLPVDVTHAGDGSGRLFVVEQAGRIRVIERGGAVAAAPFLDISSRVRAGGEMGLLGVAFHPRFEENGRLFVDYTNAPRRRALDTVIAEHRVGEDPARASDEGRELLRISQPYQNHNGGQVTFGPDGLLYIGMGDGGAANDPHDHGQRLDTLLGKLLRIGVDPSGELPYTIPADNPFAQGGGRPELYAWGLRNPWRFSFDRARPERLFVGDVGQNLWEEVHLVAKGDNCGWRILEGTRSFNVPEGFDLSRLRPPIAEYHHDEGKSVTGGFVYRGTRCPRLVGKYVFADYYPGAFWTLEERPDGTWVRAEIGRHDFMVSSFGEDEQGELYVADHLGGRILRLVEANRF